MSKDTVNKSELYKKVAAMVKKYENDDLEAVSDYLEAEAFGDLYSAACCGDIDTIRMMIDELFDNEEGYFEEEEFSSLIAACAGGYVEIVELLIENEADIEYVGGCTIKPPEFRDIDNKKLNDYEMGFVGREDLTPLAIAAGYGHKQIVEILLEAGADVTAESQDEAGYGSPYGTTALMCAAERNQTEIAKLLIEKGSDVNAADNDGTTALDVAERGGFTEMVELLKIHGGRNGGDDF